MVIVNIIDIHGKATIRPLCAGTPLDDIPGAKRVLSGFKRAGITAFRTLLDGVSNL